ncbi:hypothetical protein BG011_007146 [Mortierella polycephala]|uniref:DUF8032 domain-containing protein n=1 Tax=Mortierella polycephala TaxID=41804 RepID=A0A9P6TZ34_9FUNG|nr:hypothetical protein BG011_007146 [Mortierella polycephala]
MDIPMLQLLQPNAEVINVLSGLSTEQLACMAATLRHVQMSRDQPHNQPETIDNAARLVTPGSSEKMRQFMTVIDPGQRKSPSATTPFIKQVEGVTWLTFAYSARNVHRIFTVRADIDTVNLVDIPPELRQANCLYPSADGPEEDYKGTRRDYERQCNDQGWKLCYLNSAVLGRNKGVLQRAVVSLRNATSGQKSRRARRQEKAATQQRHQGHIPAPQRIVRPQPSSRQDLQIDNNSSPQIQRTPLLIWQPAMGPEQYPFPSHLIPTYVPQESNQASICNVTTPADILMRSPLDDSDQYMEFDGYIRGEHKRLSILFDIDQVQAEDLSFEFKKDNAVYPRSFLVNEDEQDTWCSFGIRQAEESYLNEIGWKLMSRPSVLSNATDNTSQHQSHRTRRRTQESRVRFETHAKDDRRGLDEDRRILDKGDNAASMPIEEEEQEQDAEGESMEEEFDDGSIFENLFYSQMSLLSFTGKIRTHSLGTGSGSARSRPRINPSGLRKNLQLHTAISSRIKKRSQESSSSTGSLELSGKKRTRHEAHHGTDKVAFDDDDDDDNDDGNVQEDEVEGHAVSCNDDEDEDEGNWWMSRLNSSAYPEDHNFASMTTEELIEALTSGYNSDVEDEDEDEDEDDMEDSTGRF